MIGRSLASAAVAGVLFTGTAIAQLSAPPSSNDPTDQPARIQTQNPGPRDRATPTTTPAVDQNQPQRDEIGQAGADTSTQNSDPTSSIASPGEQRTLTQKMGDGMRRAGQKVKSAFSSDKGKASKQTAQGHSLDDIADQLNACEMKPESERQACIDQATRM